ncbi:MAG: 50S ribosomal protein L10 [Bacteroidales bacterium]|nr:50S ribosomal protein L10 [Bacteroidales bacterium]
MTRDEKQKVVESLAQTISESKHFYLTDISELNAEDTSFLRRKCFEKDIKLVVVKNTLLKKALEKCEGQYDELYDVIKNSTSVMFTETGNAPAKLIKEFRKKLDKPLLKAAYVEESIYIGDDQLEMLSSIKSKEELIGDIITLLQSPAKNVLSALQSGGVTLAGIIKTLSEKE